ncbi:hypothetical protein, partial [Aeromonas hydrophila]|uniref:hypothetical protein n=1 Tax=Aeromonas hydrophila TaxID=644 RepID=UPI003D2070E5
HVEPPTFKVRENSTYEHPGFSGGLPSERNPSLQVEYQGAQQCDLALDTARAERQQAVLLLGDLVCSAQAWASQ